MVSSSHPWRRWDLRGPQRKPYMEKNSQGEFLVEAVRWNLKVLKGTSGSLRALMGTGSVDTLHPGQPHSWLPYGLGSMLDFV